ncbi:MAG: DUF2029 domain-containing protein [Chloroflexi bacterium]|nr:DUF2029 domain-containing protein [Chloroflexota bacterium]
MPDAGGPPFDAQGRPDAAPHSPRGIRGDVLYGYCRQVLSQKWSRVLVVAVLFSNGTLSLASNISLLLSERVYSQDFIQDYLLILAIVDGVNPYMPIRQLAERYLGGLPPTAYPFDHPTPHPASMGLLLLPLGGLSYTTAAAVWFGVNVAALGGTVLLLARSSTLGLPWWGFLTLVIVLIGWPPVRRELLLGQPMPLITFLVAGARWATFAGRPTLAGVSLGGALLLKPVTWMLVLVLPLRRQFGALGAALVTLLAGVLATVAAVGVAPLVTYVREVLPSVSVIYLVSGLNISVSALAWRIFRGTESYAHNELFTPPLIHARPFATTASLIFQGCVVSLMICLVTRARSNDQALLASLCLCPIINPIAWGTYLGLALIPFWYVTHSLLVYQRSAHALEMFLTLVSFVLVSTPLSVWILLAMVLGGTTPIHGRPVELPALASFLTFAPDVGLVTLAWLVLRCDPHPDPYRTGESTRSPA